MADAINKSGQLSCNDQQTATVCRYGLRRSFWLIAFVSLQISHAKTRHAQTTQLAVLAKAVIVVLVPLTTKARFATRVGIIPYKGATFATDAELKLICI